MSPASPPSLSPPPVPDAEITFPRPQVLLVTLNRPAQLNAIPRAQHFALARLWDWYDEQAALRCAILTGRGRAFCAGADLKEWDGVLSNGGNSSDGDGATAPSGKTINTEMAQDGTGERGVALRSTTTTTTVTTTTTTTESGLDATRRTPPSGFGGLSNRPGKKPVIAAVNGICFGGGMEMALNCDLVVASGARAQFALPEVAVGVVALAGALPRLGHTVGRQRAMEMALTGRRYNAEEMRAWGVVNEVVDDADGGDGEGHGAVVEAALGWADRIVANSPDSVIVSREGVKMGWEGVNPEVATGLLIKGWYGRIEKGENMVEGVRSFVEKRKPVWKDSKL